MDDGTSGPMVCSICGDSLRVNNTYGICSNWLRPECKKARLQERRKRNRGDGPERNCKVCGRLLRFDNTTGICSGSKATPKCNRKRKNLERIAMGLPPIEVTAEVTEVHAGDPFGFWTVLEDGRGVVNYVPCRCKCGTERNVTIARLTEGKSSSCGRICPARRAASPYLAPGTYGQLEVLEAALRSKDEVRVHCYKCGRNTTKQAFLIGQRISQTCGCGQGRWTHGLSRHPLYGTWNGMWDRCTKPNATNYDNYGGCGITPCAGWEGAPDGLLSFIADMGERPDGMTLDRIDPEGGYWCGHCAECVRLGRPANCRWATDAQQARNKRRVGKLTRQRNAALAELARLSQESRTSPQRHRKPPLLLDAGQGELF